MTAYSEHMCTEKKSIMSAISTHLFWLFNKGEFCAGDRKGGKNRTILLAIDPRQGRIGLMVGYGLEPFLPRKALDHVLEKAQPSLGTANYSKAIIVIIQALDDLMSGVCEGLEETLGVSSQSSTPASQEY